MIAVLKLIGLILIYWVGRNIIWMMKDSRFNCNKCDFKWKANKNADTEGFCYMQMKQPKFCSWDTTKYDKRNKARWFKKWLI